jgi:CheY-like chemotaxis protein
VSVLIVDDEQDTRELLAALFEKAGYSVITAADGAAALALLQVVRPGMIMLDLRMAGVDGAHFRESQRRNPDWVQIPTIVLTGSTDEPQLDPAIAMTLRKPARASELLKIAARYANAEPRRPT